MEPAAFRLVASALASSLANGVAHGLDALHKKSTGYRDLHVVKGGGALCVEAVMRSAGSL